MRRTAALVVTAIAVFTACESHRESDFAGRTVAASAWDTVFRIGGGTYNDTTLLNPWWIAVYGRWLAVLDPPNVNLRLFSLEDGTLHWQYDGRGSGPGEMLFPHHIAIGPDHLVWLLDNQAGKILQFDEQGFVAELSTRDLPRPPSTFVAWNQHAVFVTQSPDTALFVTDSLLRLRASGALAWRDSLDFSYNLRMALASARNGPLVLAQTYGPEFMLIRTMDGEPTRHDYVEYVPYTKKAHAGLRGTGADSARFGALAAAVFGDEVAFLFGGRPYRLTHDAEPTVLVDVYKLDTGRYDRTYVLPFHASDMAVYADSTFLLLTETEEGVPAVIGLRPASTR